MTWLRWFDDIGMADVADDSISLNPDSLLKTMAFIVETAQAAGQPPQHAMAMAVGG